MDYIDAFATSAARMNSAVFMRMLSYKLELAFLRYRLVKNELHGALLFCTKKGTGKSQVRYSTALNFIQEHNLVLNCSQYIA